MIGCSIGGKKYPLDIFESTFFKIDSFFLSSLKLKNATFQTSLSAVCKNKCSSSYKIFFFPYLFFIHTDLVDMAAGIEAVLFVCIVVILG